MVLIWFKQAHEGMHAGVRRYCLQHLKRVINCADIMPQSPPLWGKVLQALKIGAHQLQHCIRRELWRHKHLLRQQLMFGSILNRRPADFTGFALCCAAMACPLVAVVYMPAIAMQGPSPEAALAWLGCITSLFKQQVMNAPEDALQAGRWSARPAFLPAQALQRGHAAPAAAVQSSHCATQASIVRQSHHGEAVPWW